jgi:hypothetical protein
MTKEEVYVILRVDLYPEDVPLQERILPIKIVGSEEEAGEEVERLNEVEGPRGSFYFYKPVRLEMARVNPASGFSMN